MRLHVTRLLRTRSSSVIGLKYQQTPTSLTAKRNSMRSRIIRGTFLVASIALFAACGSDNGTTVTQQSVTYTSTLSAANEVRTPAVVSSATGSATYVLTGNILTYTVTVNGLTGAATLSHIHAAAAGVNGNVIVPFVTASVVSG